MEEQAVIAWFTAHSEVRTVTVTPNPLVTPLWKVTGLGGPQKLTVARPLITLESFGGTRAEARDLAKTANDMLLFRLRGVVGSVAVSSVRTVLSPRWMPYSDIDVFRFVGRYQLFLRDLQPQLS